MEENVKGKKEPTKKGCYTPEKIKIITKAIADGKSYKQAMKAARVANSTFYKWLSDKPEFAEAIKQAEAEYNDWYNRGIVKDAKKSLKELVCGYDYEEVKTETLVNSRTGKETSKKTIVVKKHVAPNPVSVIFALTNRDPENWKNRQTTEIDGTVKTEAKTEVSLAKVPDELLEQVLSKLNE